MKNYKFGYLVCLTFLITSVIINVLLFFLLITNDSNKEDNKDKINAGISTYKETVKYLSKFEPKNEDGMFLADSCYNINVQELKNYFTENMIIRITSNYSILTDCNNYLYTLIQDNYKYNSFDKNTLVLSNGDNYIILVYKNNKWLIDKI